MSTIIKGHHSTQSTVNSLFLQIFHPHIVCQVVGNLDTCTVGTQVEWCVKGYHHFKICPYSAVTMLVCYMAPGLRQQK